VTTSARSRATKAPQSPAAGLDDVTRSVRTLARSSRDLLTDAGGVLERELAMAVAVSERLRDEAVSEERLKDARSVRVQSGLRDSAHRVIDLVADAFGVATVTAVRFGESMVDQPRTRERELDDSGDRAASA
jgi:hypothetical protein